MEKNLNVLLFDPGKFASKEGNDPTHVYLFNRRYLVNGSQEFIESQLDIALKELQSDEIEKPDKNIRDPDLINGYYLTDRKGIIYSYFIDYYLKKGLLSDPVDLADFKEWFQSVVVDWLNRNRLEVVVKRDKLNEYWLKITGKVDVVVTAEK